MSLSDRDKAVLDIAGRFYRYPGARERDVLDELGLSGVRYFQILNVLIDDPAALEYAPNTVNRLHRQRVTSQRAKNPRRLGLA